MHTRRQAQANWTAANAVHRHADCVEALAECKAHPEGLLMLLDVCFADYQPNGDLPVAPSAIPIGDGFEVYTPKVTSLLSDRQPATKQDIHMASISLAFYAQLAIIA